MGSFPLRIEALLDTGSEWCVTRSDLLSHLEDQFEVIEPCVLLSRFGPLHGSLARMQPTFPADEGDELALDATWFVSPDWPGPMVIGWKGRLERMRFALDPGEESFYFGDLHGQE